MIRLLFSALTAVFLCSCAAKPVHDLSYVSGEIKERTTFGLSDKKLSEGLLIPEAISISDGLTQEEAVAVALWNNPEFHSSLSALGIARADLAEASMIKNPVFSFLFPVGPKQLESKIFFPIDFIWQRPSRVAAAKLNAESIAENLVLNGLGLVRDVNIAFNDFLSKRRIAELSQRNAEVLSEKAGLYQARYREGDISEMEFSVLRNKIMAGDIIYSSREYYSWLLKRIEVFRNNSSISGSD
ncbi:TolC family protein [candidate division KSB1 bacterium]